MTLFQFPLPMLAGVVKKTALFLPLQSRNTINVLLNSKAKPNPLLEKTKLVLLAIVAAKQHEDELVFQADVREAFGSFTLNTVEFELFDCFLGAKQGALVEFAKKGVSKERLDFMRSVLRERLPLSK